MTTVMLSFLNRSYLFLQIRRTTIKALMSLNSIKIPSPIMGLATLEHLKKLIDNSVAFIFDWIFFILNGNKDNHKSLDESNLK